MAALVQNTEETLGRLVSTSNESAAQREQTRTALESIAAALQQAATAVQSLAADQVTVSTATALLQKGGEEANAGLRELAASIGAVRTDTAALVGSAESLTELFGRTSRADTMELYARPIAD